MINRLVVFGATGDLSARYLLPAVAALHAAGHLGDRFRMTGASREDWSTEQFQEWITRQLRRHAGACPADARQAIAARPAIKGLMSPTPTMSGRRSPVTNLSHGPVPPV